MNFGRIDRDAWFTPTTTTTDLVRILIEKYPDFKNYKWFEPAAGNGAFIRGLINNGIELKNISAIDLKPYNNNDNFNIKQQDYFELTDKKYLKDTIVIGNPPYGKNNRLSIDFIKHSFDLGAEYVCFLLMGNFINSSYVKRLNYKMDTVFLTDAVQFKNDLGYYIGECSLTNSFIVFKKDEYKVNFNNIEKIIKYSNINSCNYMNYYGVLKELNKDFDRSVKVSNPNRADRWYVEGYEKLLITLLEIDKSKFDKELFKNLATLSFQGKALPDSYNYWFKNKDRLIVLDNVRDTKNMRRRFEFI